MKTILLGTVLFCMGFTMFIIIGVLIQNMFDIEWKDGFLLSALITLFLMSFSFALGVNEDDKEEDGIKRKL